MSVNADTTTLLTDGKGNKDSAGSTVDMIGTAGNHGSRYVIVSPVRDEEQYIEKTIRSVIAQTIQPSEWIIVNDGSHDNTARIIDAFAKEYPWIKVVHRTDRGLRVPGTGVMEAFYDGYQSLEFAGWDFVLKLDGDVGLEPDYFERCFERFNQDPKLGICGGVMSVSYTHLTLPTN